MAARRVEEAGDAFVEAQRLALSCISDCTVFGSGSRPGRAQTLTIWERGQRQANQLRLSTHGGVADLDVHITLTYIVEVVGVQAFAARTTSYQYEVSDIAGQELVIYDWHPTGRSPVSTPHLHIPAARPSCWRNARVAHARERARTWAPYIFRLAPSRPYPWWRC